MKTPRELLLARHAAARPRLDALRAAVLAELPAAEAVSPAQSWGTTLWQQMVIACRPAWAALGAAWGLILLLNTTSSTVAGRPAVAVASRPSPEVEAILTAQRQLWVELTAPANPPPPRAKDRPSSPSGALLPHHRRDGLKTLA